jgi:enamine deaminase RidA (YjgF/YER057c/UK114 family)
MNEVYREYFPEGPPARTTVGIQLLKPEWLVEIAVVAYLGK